MEQGRPLLYNTVEALQEAIENYFETCIEKEEPLTITGLCLAIGCTRQTLINYEKREGFFDTIKRAKLRCENYAEKRLFGGGSPAGAIFALKNYGWSDALPEEGSEAQPVKVEILRQSARREKSGHDND